MKIGEKLTFVNFMKKITDGLAKIIFRQDVMGGEWGGLWGLANVIKRVVLSFAYPIAAFSITSAVVSVASSLYQRPCGWRSLPSRRGQSAQRLHA